MNKSNYILFYDRNVEDYVILNARTGKRLSFHRCLTLIKRIYLRFGSIVPIEPATLCVDFFRWITSRCHMIYSRDLVDVVNFDSNGHVLILFKRDKPLVPLSPAKSFEL